MIDLDRQASNFRGFSLIEVMISMTIGIFLLIGLVTSFSTASRSQKAIEQSGSLIENGRYALNVFYDDIRHAGYYGYYSSSSAALAALPDPCETMNNSVLGSAMELPIQGYNAASKDLRPDLSSALGCATLLTSANLKPGSDVVVVRRADTGILTGSPTTGEVYLQANVSSAAIQTGVASANLATSGADGSAVTIFKRNGVTPADIRKFHVRVYFVAPCRDGTGTNGVCASVNDGIPTLKRLELTASGGSPAMVITPLAEGVEYLKVQYGIDSSPSTADPVTGYLGDGVPDDPYLDAPSTISQWVSVVAVRVFLLVRNSVTTAGQVDAKSYVLGSLAVVSPSDGFNRHVFSSEIRVNNVAGRREPPP